MTSVLSVMCSLKAEVIRVRSQVLQDLHRMSASKLNWQLSETIIPSVDHPRWVMHTKAACPPTQGSPVCACRTWDSALA